MKLSKDELIAKINGYAIDDNVKIELMEDVTDSFENTVDTSETDELKAKYEELKQKYKDRFLKGEETEKEKETKDETDNPEMEEKEVIDIKEI